MVLLLVSLHLKGVLVFQSLSFCGVANVSEDPDHPLKPKPHRVAIAKLSLRPSVPLHVAA